MWFIILIVFLFSSSSLLCRLYRVDAWFCLTVWRCTLAPRCHLLCRSKNVCRTANCGHRIELLLLLLCKTMACVCARYDCCLMMTAMNETTGALHHDFPVAGRVGHGIRGSRGRTHCTHQRWKRRARARSNAAVHRTFSRAALDACIAQSHISYHSFQFWFCVDSAPDMFYVLTSDYVSENICAAGGDAVTCLQVTNNSLLSLSLFFAASRCCRRFFFLFLITIWWSEIEKECNSQPHRIIIACEERLIDGCVYCSLFFLHFWRRHVNYILWRAAVTDSAWASHVTHNIDEQNFNFRFYF